MILQVGCPAFRVERPRALNPALRNGLGFKGLSFRCDVHRAQEDKLIRCLPGFSAAVVFRAEGNPKIMQRLKASFMLDLGCGGFGTIGIGLSSYTFHFQLQHLRT